MRRVLTILFCALLAACNAGSGGAMLPGWIVYNGTPLTIGADGLPSFAFPNAPPAPNYLMAPSPATIGGTLAAAWTIAGDAGAAFDYHTNADNTCVGVATAGFYIQRAGDTWSGAGVYQQYRFFSLARAPLALGATGITASLDDPAGWIDVYGQPGSANPPAFASAKANAGTWGLVLGGGCFAGHGVFVDPPAQARFALTSFGAQ